MSATTQAASDPDRQPGTTPDPAASQERVSLTIGTVAAASGAVMGVFSIANTSIGWHLAAGRWILEHRMVPRADPFSLTCGGNAWLDHEWLFQVVAALLDSLAGPAALVLMRAAAMAVLAVLLVMVGVRSGLARWAALLLAVLCVAGARPRFFVRPEIVTLLVVPASVWLYLSRRERSHALSLGGIGVLMLVGANAHGGVIILPFLLAGLLAAETLQAVASRSPDRQHLLNGAAAVAVSGVAGLVNPYGWDLYAAPFRLAALIADPAVPNPEWFTPTFAQVPALFIALAASLVMMILRGRDLPRWALFLMASVLALRYVRNLGLLFVLLPLAVAPALASWRALSQRVGAPEGVRHPRTELLAVAAVLVLAASVAIAPQPGLGLGYAADFYPGKACDFLDREGLPRAELYNDVRFGGYLIDRYWPQRRVFQDDRNEIHEKLLREIWEILSRSDEAAFSELLKRYDCDTALVRYHPPLRVQTPDGVTVGERGFSALWFPAESWALVYWDDLAMVFVRRDEACPDLLRRWEYHVIRPDDLGYLAQSISREPELLRQARAEARRALDVNPASERAAAITSVLTRAAVDPTTAR